MITQNVNIRLANQNFFQKKYVVRTCHLKDFRICRQDFEKRWREGRKLSRKNDHFFDFFETQYFEVISTADGRLALNALF